MFRQLFVVLAVSAALAGGQAGWAQGATATPQGDILRIGDLPYNGGWPAQLRTAMKPKETGGEVKPPKKAGGVFKPGKSLKETVKLTGEPTRLDSCGTVWSGWIEDPDSDINPCPEGCIRGDATLTKTYQAEDKLLYDIRYQCYREREPAGGEVKPATIKPGKSMRIDSCGTFWSGWVDDPDSDVNPCPEGCVRGEAALTKTYQAEDKLLYDINYQCYREKEPAGKSPAAIKNSKGDLTPKAPTGGGVIPASGPWHTFVHITGDEFQATNSARIVWYPNDDDTLEPAGSSSATLRGVSPVTGVEIEMPAGAGGPQGGIVRIMLYQNGVKEPVMAGRFMADNPSARADLRKKMGADISSKPVPVNLDTGQSTTPSSIDPAELPAGSPGGMTAGTGAGANAPATDGTMADMGGREVSTKKMDASGPPISGVSAQGPTMLKVTWAKVAGADVYTAYAVERGANQPIAGPGMSGTGTGNSLSYTLDGLTPGFDYTVWVNAGYPDGKTGTSEQRTITMPSPVNPTGFTAAIIETGSVKLSWDPVPGAEYYWVEGANLARQQTTATEVTVTNLPTGRHKWTVVAAYAKGVYSMMDPPRASASFETREEMVARAFEAGQANYPNNGPDPELWKRLGVATEMDYDQLVNSFAAIWALSNSYKHILGRDASPDEARNYIAQLNGGRSWQAVWRELAQSAERDQRFGHWAPAPIASVAEARTVFHQPSMKNAESCFGGLGDRCDTGMVGEPVWENAFTMPDGTRMAYVVVNVAVGSILHDNMCLKHSDGLHCDNQYWHWVLELTAGNLNPLGVIAKAVTPAAIEWNKAFWNVVDGRKWRERFGPYPLDADLRRSTWYDDLRAATAREAWMAPVVGMFTIPVHTQRYDGEETRGSHTLAADPGMFLDYLDDHFCRSQSFSRTDSKFGAASWGTCR